MSKERKAAIHHQGAVWPWIWNISNLIWKTFDNGLWYWYGCHGCSRGFASRRCAVDEEILLCDRSTYRWGRADMQNKRSAPFISKEIFNSYKELGELSRSVLSRFALWRIICESSQEMVQFNHQYYDKRKLNSNWMNTRNSSPIFLMIF